MGSSNGFRIESGGPLYMTMLRKSGGQFRENVIFVVKTYSENVILCLSLLPEM